MKNKCKTCGRDYHVEPPFVDGQEIVCPYCGAMNVYRAPARIEIPVGARRVVPPDAEATIGSQTTIRPSVLPEKRPSARTIPQAASTEERGEIPTPAKKTVPSLQPVSRLHVIRPGDKTAQAGSAAQDNALVERVRARARAESRRQLLKKFGVVLKDLFWILVLAVLVIVGWQIFGWWSKKPAQKPVAVQPAEESAGTSAETHEPAAPVQQSVAKPQAKPEAIVPTTSEEIGVAIKAARVSFYGMLPQRERLGAVDGRFALVIPYAGTVMRCYGIVSTPTGVVSVVRSDAPGAAVPTGERGQEAAAAEYGKELSRQGGFVIRSGVAYYVTRANAPKTWNPPLAAGEDFCASKAYFGNAYELIRKQGWRTEDLRFDIILSFGEKVDPVRIATVGFGETTRYADFKRAAEPFAMKIREHNLPRPKTKTYRPTVVFSDGKLIGSKLNGITKVPRKPQYLQGPEYIRWRQLADEAERQEREAWRIRSENEANVSAWKRQLEASVTDEEIRKALMASTVRINRRAEGGK